MYDEKATFDFNKDLTLETASAIVDGNICITPSSEVWARCAASHARLLACVDEARHVYGLTTGFGPLANRLVDPADGLALQQNLVHHLATGLGQKLGWTRARAVCLARLTSILRGYSGASRPSIEALVALLNSDLAPALPERGTVGASGDLTPLAHLVLALQGRGSFLTRTGEECTGSEGLAALGLTSLNLESRDALALVNGTSAMTGIALQNVIEANRLVDWSIVTSAALLEVLQGRAEAWSPILAEIRPHAGQLAATERLNRALGASAFPNREFLSDRRLDGFQAEAVAGQDAYSLRCAPQVIGGVLDSLDWHRRTVEVELNAVSDNPVFPPESKVLALHGGNFMGQHIALASDAANLAVVVLAGFSERQLARLTDETLNQGLPAFLHQSTPGLNSGFMGAQVTATATLAEMRSHGPASVHSISTNGANQDVVSMGTIGARQAHKQIQHASEIIAILSLAIAQAMDIKRISTHQKFSNTSEELCERVREISPRLDQDRPLSTDIEQLALEIRTSAAIVQ